MKSLKKFLPISFRDTFRSEWHNLNIEFKIFIAKISRQFHRPPFPILDSSEVNLHLGCGLINHPKFINIDGMPYPHVHYVRAIDDLSPFKDESISLIYACHCLEHFSHIEVPVVISKWIKKLKPGGILRLSVPDFDKLVDIYLENHKDVDLILSSLMGGQGDKFDFHKVAFNSESLKKLLLNAGFHEVREWHPSDCTLSNFDDWSSRPISIYGKNYFVSLNLEAVK